MDRLAAQKFFPCSSTLLLLMMSLGIPVIRALVEVPPPVISHRRPMPLPLPPPMRPSPPHLPPLHGCSRARTAMHMHRSRTMATQCHPRLHRRLDMRRCHSNPPRHRRRHLRRSQRSDNRNSIRATGIDKSSCFLGDFSSPCSL